MAAPFVAPSIESIANQDLAARIEKLEAIINLYIRPTDSIFSDEETTRDAAIFAIEKTVERRNNVIYQLADIFADLEDIKTRLGIVEHKRTPGTVTEKRLKRTDDLLVSRKNMPISFSEMKCLQEFKFVDKKHDFRRQDMTKLGRVYEQFPDKYEVRDSRLGGKTIRLNPVYYKHLTKGGV